MGKAPVEHIGGNGRVARLLSSQRIFLERERLSDFGNSVTSLHNASNIDRRVENFDSLVFVLEALADCSAPMQDAIWATGSVTEALVMFSEMPPGSAPAKWLYSYYYMSDFILNAMVDGSKEVTFGNNVHLNQIEKFVLPEFKNSYDLTYDVADEQDLFDGSMANTFDFIMIHGYMLWGVTNKKAEAMINNLKIGGKMVVGHVSPFGQIYEKSQDLHNYRNIDIIRYMANHESCQTVNLPYNHGFLVLVRTK